MNAPDLNCISEILLFSYGFKEAKNLGSKIVLFYEFCN